MIVLFQLVLNQAALCSINLFCNMPL